MVRGEGRKECDLSHYYGIIKFGILYLLYYLCHLLFFLLVELPSFSHLELERMPIGVVLTLTQFPTSGKCQAKVTFK